MTLSFVENTTTIMEPTSLLCCTKATSWQLRLGKISTEKSVGKGFQVWVVHMQICKSWTSVWIDKIRLPRPQVWYPLYILTLTNIRLRIQFKCCQYQVKIGTMTCFLLCWNKKMTSRCWNTFPTPTFGFLSNCRCWGRFVTSRFEACTGNVLKPSAFKHLQFDRIYTRKQKTTKWVLSNTLIRCYDLWGCSSG